MSSGRRAAPSRSSKGRGPQTARPKRVEERAEAQPKARAPAKAEARSPPASPPPAAASAADKSAYMAQWPAAIRSRLFYPPAARARGARGVVGVSFTIGASGGVSSFAITRSSGDADLDARGAGARAVGPFPAAARRPGPRLHELQLCPALTPRACVRSSSAPGGGGGVPQWNCNCRVCRLAWDGDPRVKPRTQSSLAVSADGRRWLLLNASIDLRQQVLATPAMQPKGEGRHSPIAAVLLTNTDVDHAAGLLALRERQPFTIFGTRATLDTIGANRIFDVVARDIVPRRAVASSEPFEPLPGLSVELFPVPGKVPLWLEEGEVKTDAIGEGTVGVAVEAGGRTPRLRARLRARHGRPARAHRRARTRSSSTARSSPTTR